MQVNVERGQIQGFDADAAVVNLFQGVTSPGGATGAVDQALGGQISQVIGGGDFKGKLGETLVLYGGEGLAAPRVVLVGLGKPEKFGLDEVRRVAASAAKAARERGVKHLATIVHGAGIGGLDASAAAQATVEGTLLGLYRFTVYKSDREAEDRQNEIQELTLVELDEEQLGAVRSGAAAGEAVAAGVALARDLANHPSSTATPTHLAEQAGVIAARHGMRLEVWDRERIQSEGMGALASVAAGTEEPPRFIKVEHTPDGTSDRAPHVLVGKGITFDSGGISLKPGPRMGNMKYDMCGAAAVLGALETIGRLDLPLHVYGLVAATENMPSGKATKPGDVVVALNGTTIEILNTDAEGRLILADALSYAQRLEPAAVVDMATLTGAILSALGRHAAGLFANDDDFAAGLVAAGGLSRDQCARPSPLSICQRPPVNSQRLISLPYWIDFSTSERRATSSK